MSAGTGPDVFPQRRNTFAAREKIGIASPLIAHSGEHAAHIGEAFDHPGHRVVTVDLILQVYVALVFDGDERLKDGADRHFSVPYRHLALFDLQVGEVLLRGWPGQGQSRYGHSGLHQYSSPYADPCF